MKRLVVLIGVVASAVVIRAQLRPPAPQVIRMDAVQPSEDTSVARGKLLYSQNGCPMCHGVDGAGGFDNPNSETEEKVPGVIKVAHGYTEDELIALLRRGTARIGRADASGPVPPYRMPGWGDRLTDAELEDLVRYLISLAPKDTSWR